jgi:tRNA(Glu) U13 pseudouridine synthase TruD
LKSLKIATKGNLLVPGFATKLGKDAFSKTIKKLLEKDNLTLESFNCTRMPELAVAGELRMTVIKPKNFKISKEESDELTVDKKKLKLSFTLPKGSYATTLIENLL